MIDPPIGRVTSFALAVLLLSAAWLAGERLGVYRASVRKLRFATHGSVGLVRCAA
jgi:hypothetical protein